MKGCLPEPWQKKTCRQGMMDVGDQHQVHWRSYGNPANQAVLFVHGGPGSGADISHLCFFDPQKHFVILFDQRGAGESTPSASLVANTTAHLIQDMEQLRQMLGLDAWIVFGGSWGATLALLYAQYHADAVSALVLRGTSNSHEFQNNWVLNERPLQMPERHAAFLENLSENERLAPVLAHFRCITSDDQLRRLQAVQAVDALESGLTMAEAEPFKPLELSLQGRSPDDLAIVNRACIYLHYWINNKFLGKHQCLPNPSALNQISVFMVHGQSDWICPCEGARVIAQKITHAHLVEVPGAGHSPFHAGMRRELLGVMEELS